MPWPTYYVGRNDPITVCFNTICERPYFYADWYSTASNLVRHLRFHGSNFSLAGQHMYGGTNFPSVFNDNDNGTGGATIQCQHDWGGILGAIFSENDCGYVSSFEYINNSIIVGQGMPTGRQLSAGMPTLLAVSHHGKAIDTGFGIYHPAPLPSHVHSKLQEMLLTEVDEVIALNREYPAWNGSNFLLHSICGPSFGEVGGDSLKCGYEDVAVERFEKATGIPIPVDVKDPKRFRKRYEWFQTHPKELEAWVQWRCDVLLEVNRKIRDQIRAAQPDCNLHVNFAYPYSGREELLQDAAAPESLRKYIMIRGWDVRAYQREERMVLYTMATADAEKRLLMNGKTEEMPLERACALHPNYLALFANDGRRRVDVHAIFTENQPHAAPGEWVWSTNGAWNGYHWPAGDGFCDFWTNTLIRTNPTRLAFNWHDSNMDSRLEPGLRRFVRAWGPLPNGHYDMLRGNGRDKNLVLQRRREHPGYHYAANPWSWEATVELTFSADARVTDLHTNRQSPLDSRHAWRVKLPPYGVRSFRVEAGGSVESAAVIIANDAIEQLHDRLHGEETLAQRRNGESGGASAVRFAGMVANLDQAFDRSDYGVVEDTLRGGYEYHLVRSEMERRHKDNNTK